MDPKRILVVYYSRTGTTREVARALRDELGCEIDRIADRGHAVGVFGYLRASFDVVFGRPASLRPMSTNPNDYDVVVVGTPVWNASVSTPVKTFLRANRHRIGRVAFFCTYGSSGSGRAMRQMEEVCGQAPIVTMALRSEEVARRSFDAKVRAFAAALKASAKVDAPSLQPAMA